MIVRRTAMARVLDVVAILVHNFRPSEYLRLVKNRILLKSEKESHLSYAEDVRNDMTRPRTVPSTPSSPSLRTRLWGVNMVIAVTTESIDQLKNQRVLFLLTGSYRCEEQSLPPDVVDDSGKKHSPK